MARPGSQLSSLLAAFGGGRRPLSLWPPAVKSVRATSTAYARAIDAGYDASAARDLAAAIDGLEGAERVRMLTPLAADDDGLIRFGGAIAQQSDQTSCVATCLAVTLAAGDIGIALWLETGIDPSGSIAKYGLERLVATPDRADADAPAARLRALEQALKYRATHRGAMRTWPKAWGTPPWGAARIARFGQVRYQHRLVNDLDPDRAALAVVSALSAVRHGMPALLYTGGDSTMGYRAAMPRHAVVLYRPDTADPDDLRIFDPAQGRVHVVDKTDLIRPGAATAAYGGWPHLAWLVLPRPPRH